MPVDARAYLERLVGQTIPTITGKPNTIVAVRGDDVFVRTQDTAPEKSALSAANGRMSLER